MMTRRELIPSLIGALGVGQPETGSPSWESAKLAWLRKHHGDSLVLDAIQQTNGDVREAARILNRIWQRNKRQGERNRRREARIGNQILYVGPVRFEPGVLDQIQAKTVRSKMTGRNLLRGHTSLPLRIGEHETSGNQTIICIDFRRYVADSQMMAEFIWTGADYRLHCWTPANWWQRQEDGTTVFVSDSAGVPVLLIAPDVRPIAPPLPEPQADWISDGYVDLV